MRQQKRWICHGCNREWAYDPSPLTIGVKWDGETCPRCGSPDIEHVSFTPPFPGGDWHPMNVQPIPDSPTAPDVSALDQLSIAENRTLAIAQIDNDFDYGTS